MEHLEKLIPLAVLLGVAAFLVVLLRRAMRENTLVEPANDVVVKTAPVIVEVSRKEVPRSLEPVELPPAPAEVAAPLPKLPKQTLPAAATKTPIHGVLDLLRKKDALVTAFLLREILGPPVSKRRR